MEFLRRRGAAIRFGRRLRGISYTGSNASHLDFGAETVALQDAESVVLALPPSLTADLVPALTVPKESHAIVNAHFRLSTPADLPAELPILGLIGGTAQWIFVRGDIASITVSAANPLAEEPAGTIARKTWSDLAKALGRDRDRLPRYRIVKEKRATFAQTPEEVQRRPGTRSRFANLYLAGDWIDTSLPATIESAVRSGHMAARAVASVDRGA